MSGGLGAAIIRPFEKKRALKFALKPSEKLYNFRVV